MTQSMTFECTKTFNLDGALRGMRNPMDSWDKSDSYTYNNLFMLGENDKRLAQDLIKGGAPHRKFIRQIFVCVDITAPRYWWTEFDTYRVGVEKDSCSTMHKIMAYPFTMNMFAIPESDMSDPYEQVTWEETIHNLNKLRRNYLKTKEDKYFFRLKRHLPESFLQKRTVTLSYEAIYQIIQWRSNHRLQEWHDFVDWAKTLPYAKELLFIE